MPFVLCFVFLPGCQTEKENAISNNVKSENMEKQAKIELGKLLMEYEQALNSSDAGKATGLYARNGMFMPSGAPTAIGLEHIKEAYDFVFSNIQLNIEFSIEEITLEHDLAYAVTGSRGTTLIRATGETIPEENRELFIFEKEEKGWKIARYMFNKTR